MGIIVKIKTHFLKGSKEEKKLFVLAFIYSFLVRFFMLKVKYKFYEKYMGQRGVETTYQFPEDKKDIILTVRKIVLAISKHTAWESKCMVQALTCKWLLNRYNIDSTLYYGIQKSSEVVTGLKAHAWLRVGDTIATGAQGHKKFKIVNFYS